MHQHMTSSKTTYAPAVPQQASSYIVALLSAQRAAAVQCLNMHVSLSCTGSGDMSFNLFQNPSLLSSTLTTRCPCFPVPCLPTQLEAVPLGKCIKQLRQHSSPDVQQQATRLLAKMRQDVKSACARSAKAKPIVAKLGVKKTVAL